MSSQGDHNQSDFDQRSTQFVRWFTQANGTRLSSNIRLADLRADGAGRGVVAVTDLEEDEELFAVPHDLVLGASTSSIPQDVLQGLDEAGSWPPLIVAIIYEHLKGESSLWYPYFRVLPSTFDTLMFWSDAELKELQASAVARKIGKRNAEAGWRETIIPVMLKHPDLFPVSRVDESGKIDALIQLAHMAGSLIMAYAFDIDRDNDDANNDNEDGFQEDDEDEPLKGMVPFADMLNADADRNNARLFQEEDYLVMRTTKPIAQGEQIFNDYGPLPRSDLLRMYGYVTDQYAQYDVVEFEHDLLVDIAGMRDKKNNAVWQKREEQLDEIGIIDDGYTITRPVAGAQLEEVVPGNVHMLLRGLTLDATASKTPKARPDESMSIKEVALLSAVATKKLAEYPTSVEQDRATVTSLKGSSPGQLRPDVSLKRYLAAVEVRLGEKQILWDLIHLCQEFIAKATNAFAGDRKRKHGNDDDTTSKKNARTKGER